MDSVTNDTSVVETYVDSMQQMVDESLKQRRALKKQLSDHPIIEGTTTPNLIEGKKHAR